MFPFQHLLVIRMFLFCYFINHCLCRFSPNFFSVLFLSFFVFLIDRRSFSGSHSFGWSKSQKKSRKDQQILSVSTFTCDPHYLRSFLLYNGGEKMSDTHALSSLSLLHNLFFVLNSTANLQPKPTPSVLSTRR